MGKVMEFISAKFLNTPKLVLSNPKLISIEPDYKSLSLKNSAPCAKVREINLSIPKSQLLSI